MAFKGSSKFFNSHPELFKAPKLKSETGRRRKKHKKRNKSGKAKRKNQPKLAASKPEANPTKAYATDSESTAPSVEVQFPHGVTFRRTVDRVGAAPLPSAPRPVEATKPSSSAPVVRRPTSTEGAHLRSDAKDVMDLPDYLLSRGAYTGKRSR